MRQEAKQKKQKVQRNKGEESKREKIKARRDALRDIMNDGDLGGN